jgi:hypothetical protein
LITPWSRSEIASTSWSRSEILNNFWPRSEISRVPWSWSEILNTPWSRSEILSTPWSWNEVSHIPWSRSETSLTRFQRRLNVYLKLHVTLHYKRRKLQRIFNFKQTLILACVEKVVQNKVVNKSL